MVMSKGRTGPHRLRVQQSVSSLALYTSWPIEFLILYLFFVSQPRNASNISTFCFTISWSICVRYSRPGGQLSGASICCCGAGCCCC